MNDGPRRRTDRPPLQLSYIIGNYPVLTETFIDREIEQLIERGVDLEIVSIRRPLPSLTPSQRALGRRVQYLLPASAPAVCVAHLAFLLRRPRTYLGTLLWLITRPHPAARFRTALHFGTGVYAAWVLRHRRGIHIHAHFVDRAATVALVAARLLDTTYSVSAHAREIYVQPVLLKERISEAAFVATCTEYSRRYLAAQVGSEAASRIIRLYHGLELTASDRAHHPGSRTSDGLLLAVAQLVERKGLRYLIEACRLLVDRGNRISCEIVGDGPLRGDLEHLIRSLGLEGVVRLVGPLPYPEVMERYQRASALVLPCVITSEGDRDGIPNVILEAMAAGVPVISTDISAIPEVVRDGDTGLVVAQADAVGLADAVQRLLMNPSLASRLAEGGRLLLRSEFDLSRNVDRLLERFAEVTRHAEIGHE